MCLNSLLISKLEFKGYNEKLLCCTCSIRLLALYLSVHVTQFFQLQLHNSCNNNNRLLYNLYYFSGHSGYCPIAS